MSQTILVQATQLAQDFFSFWIENDTRVRPECDEDLFIDWSCCDYHRSLQLVSAEFDRRLSKVHELTNLKSMGNPGSERWWQDLHAYLGIQEPEVMADYYFYQDGQFLVYLYEKYELESVIWELEDHEPDYVLLLANAALVPEDYEQFERYQEQLLARYGLDEIRSVIGKQQILHPDHTSRFTRARQSLPV